MTRSTSATFRAAINAEETSEAFLILLHFAHADIPATIKLVNNYVDIDNAGPGNETYIAYPFNISIPSDLEDTLPRIQLTIDNVDRFLMDEIRSLTSAPDISIYVVLASTPSVIEAGPFESKLRNVSYSASTITGDLQVEDILNEPYPGTYFTPQTFPGLF